MATLDCFDIKGRSALVTGAASGIGLAYAEAMAEAGAAVTLADIDAAGAEREAARLREAGHEARADVCDVSSADAVAAAFDAHDKAYGGLDICFANAGIDAGAGFWNPAGHRNPDGQVDTYDPARWDKSIAVNLSGVFYTVSNAVRIMKKEGRANGRTGTHAAGDGHRRNTAIVNRLAYAVIGGVHPAEHAFRETGIRKDLPNKIRRT